jgi:hypothetical protein
MPIRMTDDPQESQDSYHDRGGGQGGGGGGGLFNLLPLLLGLFRGKGGIVVLLLIVGGYFLLNRGGCNLSQLADSAGGLSTGGFLDPKQFEKANIYESLSDDDTKNPLPESANLQRFAPTPGNQGQQGSCVAWSSAYAARSIVESSQTGAAGEQIKFSPAFLYNQIGLEGCQGSYIIRAMEYMTKQGSVPYDDFQYTDQDCSRQPDQSLIRKANDYRMRGFNRLSLGDRNDKVDLRAIKENLSQGAPVVIGMMVGPSFMQGMMGQDVWVPQSGDEQQMGFGGHAMCVVGYDDRKYNGAFLIMNSWGPEWGNNGFAWVRYPHFDYFVREAYGLEPMKMAAANQPFEVKIGLVQVERDFEKKKTVTKGYIPLGQKQPGIFTSLSAITPGTSFKMEVQNKSECYIYVFGQETNGTSYTLFPYPRSDDETKTKYSPFCGITGYRLFPKDKSMTADSIGTKDVIAIVVTREPLDWYDFNRRLSSSPQTDYRQRLSNLLKQNTGTEAAYNDGTVILRASTGSTMMGCVVEINKK